MTFSKKLRKTFTKTIVISALFVNSCATSQMTELKKQELVLYSEYYPNHNSKFKGTIIFENGSGTDISEWKDNQTFFNCIKQLGSVFLYDRSGFGKSLPDFSLSPTSPLTAKSVANKLKNLLKQKNIRPPYVFVAHSYGAIYAGYFILQNQSLIKSVLFVDPVPKDFQFSEQRIQKYTQGIEDAKMHDAKYIYKKYSGSDAEVIYQLLGFAESKQSLRNLGNINDDIPIVILTSTGMENDHPLKEDWYISQKQWLNKNAKSRIIQINSDHFIQIRKPKEVCNELEYILNE